MKPSYSPVTLGEQIKRFDVGPFALTEASYAPSRALPRHAHDCVSISFVLKGACIETVGNSAYECTPFSPIIKPAGEFHSNQYSPAGAKCLLIEVKPLGLEMTRSASALLGDVVHLKDGALGGIAMRLYKEFRIRDTASAVSIEGLVLEMIGAAARHRAEVVSPRPPRWLREARELVNERFRERISLFNVAASVGMNPAYLSRMFRKHYRCTVGDYLRGLRLEYASERMAHSLDSMAEIAAAAGFYDQSHFTHAFKLHTGLTPTEFRAASRKK
ncbi:MAG: helix-turn-helix domain-containing protein [Pyrinomonadaceae bacterium]